MWRAIRIPPFWSRRVGLSITADGDGRRFLELTALSFAHYDSSTSNAQHNGSAILPPRVET